MKHRLGFPLALTLAAGLLLWSCPAADEAASTLTSVGQAVPQFKVTALDGTQFDTAQLKGKVVLLNFFATWCGPCMQEMPHLEKEVWQTLKSRGLVVLAVGREHSADELQKFQKQKGFTFPIAADPKREIYGKFATQFIPRTYLINAEGKIVFQSVGYDEKEFKELTALAGKLLPAP